MGRPKKEAMPEELVGLEPVVDNIMAAPEQKVHKRTDLDWSDWVLSHLDDTEIQDGNPKVDGLRRLAETFVGQIIESETKVIYTNLSGVDRCAVVESHISFVTEDGTLKKFSGAADATFGNTDGEFSVYLTAMAETRAEGRALRKALNLKRPVAEEITETPVTDPDINEKSKVNENQIRTIDSLCKKLNFSVNDYINSGEKRYNKIEEIPFKTGAKIIKTLSAIQNKRENPPENIPSYDENWRKQ